MYLKSCPFCGSDVEAYPMDDKHIHKQLYQLVHTCGGHNRICLQWATPAEIQAAWNARVGEKE